MRDFVYEYRPVLSCARLFMGCLFLITGTTGLTSLIAQETDYRVVVTGTLRRDPTAIHSFTESVLLEPTPSVLTNDRNPAQPIAVAVSPNGETLAVATQDDHRFMLLNSETLQIQRRFNLSGAGMDVVFSADGNSAFALSEAPWGKPAQIFHFQLDQPRWDYWDLPSFSQPRELFLTPDQRTLIVRGTTSLCFVDLSDFSTNLVRLTATSGDWVFSADGRSLYVSNFGSTTAPGSTVEKIDLASQTVVAQISLYKNPGAMSLSPDGRWLAVATFDAYPYRKTGLIQFIDTETDTVLSRPHQANSFINEIQWLPDNQMMVYLADSFGYLQLRPAEANSEPRIYVDVSEMVATNPSRKLFKQAHFDQATGMAYARFQDAVFGFDTRNHNRALRFPLGYSSTDMALSQSGRDLFVTTSASNDSHNRVMRLKTNKFTSIQEHVYPYQHHHGWIDPTSETLQFSESGKRFWAVEASALCQVTENTHSSNLYDLYRMRTDDLLLGREPTNLCFFDSNTGQKIRSIPLGSSPNTMVVSPDEQFVMITNSSSATVSLIDIAEQQLVAHVPVGVTPRKLVATNTHAYVANEGGNSLSVLDLETAVVSNTIALNFRPTDLQLSADGATLLVLHQSNGRVSVIDTTDETVLQEVAVSTRVSSFKINGAGDRFVLGLSSPKELQLYTRDETNGTWTFAAKESLPYAPYGLFLTPDDARIYAGISYGRRGEGEFYVYGGRDLSPIAVLPTVDMPKFIHFSPASAGGGAETLPIADPVLKAFLVGLYDQNCDAELSPAEIDAVTVLNFPADSSSTSRVTDLTGLAAFPNLQTIRLPNHAVTALSPLPVSLVELQLDGNQIEQLAEVPEGLLILDVSRNPLVSVAALPSTLIAAMFDHTQLANLPVLPNAMRILVLDNTPGVDLTGLDLSNLWWLGLSGWDQADLPSGLTLSALRYLDLVNNRCTLVPDLTAMPNLIFLDLTQNPLDEGICDQLAELAVSRPNLDVSIGNLTGETPNCESEKRGKQRPSVRQLLNQIRANGGAL